MIIKEAELRFHARALATPIIRKHDQENSWTIALTDSHKLNQILETARGQVRLFKRQNAAMGIVFEIKFGEISN
ncbi:hypothetical protein AU255_18175 [Methyloprofundus sedimenti]|uniref:Uncharacterized protein n=1 Tax=Methyloprofundus sedimenti TaxID=1420851 RepID=A0A1V8M1M5_9GAMM|nr:hypothetical protein [Methyloprofundus sedimenti]OQK15396.1 hypothetical protein AU255_18175 [Methyloprofundus sedimenti]